MEKIYDPKMNQREFMLKALQSEDKLKPRDVLAFWKQRKAVESVDKQQKLRRLQKASLSALESSRAEPADAPVSQQHARSRQQLVTGELSASRILSDFRRLFFP